MGGKGRVKSIFALGQIENDYRNKNYHRTYDRRQVEAFLEENNADYKACYWLEGREE